MKDQCASHAAPCAIQRRKRSFCAAVRLLCEAAGGINSAGVVVAIRAQTALASGFPGTTGTRGTCEAGPGRFPNSPSRVSSRSPACRFAESGPWHAKQLSESTGRMSRLNSIFPETALAARGLVGAAPASAASTSPANTSPPICNLQFTLFNLPFRKADTRS